MNNTQFRAEEYKCTREGMRYHISLSPKEGASQIGSHQLTFVIESMFQNFVMNFPRRFFSWLKPFYKMRIATVSNTIWVSKQKIPTGIDHPLIHDSPNPQSLKLS